MVRRKLQGWKTKLLNQAGKEVLIKAVVQAIPSYVSIWVDKWIPLLPSFSVTYAKPPLCPDITVSRLIHCEEKRWNRRKLEDLFTTEEIDVILAIPIGGDAVRDELIWTGHSGDILKNQSLWKSLWHLKVPHKIRSFLWKLYHNILPTKGIFSNRFHGAFSSSPACPRCGEMTECIELCLFFCPFAQAVWRASGFSYMPNLIGFPGFSKWWVEILLHPANRSVDFHCELMAFLCWHIWKARNNFLFLGSIESPTQVWLVAERGHPLTCTPIHMDTPENGYVKINCDASFTVNPHVAAAALQLSFGIPMFVLWGGGEASLVQARSAVVAKALTIRLDLETTFKIELSRIVIESDNLNFVNCIVSKNHTLWETTAVEEDIIALSYYFSYCSFSFVLRRCSQAANWMTRNIRSLSCPCNWPINIPHGLRPLL
ncbi:hypothetical protein GQ457_06G016200 [Hibiscus cannabinus]